MLVGGQDHATVWHQVKTVLYIKTPGPLRTTGDVSERDGSSAGQTAILYLYSQKPISWAYVRRFLRQSSTAKWGAYERNGFGKDCDRST
ncbi:MAG: hypothetical protein LZF60_50077 [Nitrospira sp.]|nr:MAG: hypothetical protein LZF60_50077 [Nitrospira sp.]